MQQRTSVMLSALVFAAVVAGAIAYLVYTRPSEEVAMESTTPTPEASQIPLAELITFASPTPTVTPTPAEFRPVEITRPTPIPRVAAAVKPSAPTGPAEFALIATFGSIVAGVLGIRKFSA